ncbi:MAG: hypothetical protein GWP91_07950, partial [Rhodobacterales bacterium]|nr:hypothetical protein [Rhodobacterales bacterium]
MTAPNHSWLDPALSDAFQNRQRVLLLCRNRATVAAVRRWIAHRDGWLGADVATVHGLALQVYRPPLYDGPEAQVETPVPPHTQMGALVAGRPGLSGVARRWTHQLRRMRALGGEVSAPSWLTALGDSDWAPDPALPARQFLLQRARHHPKRLTESQHYDATIAIGFSHDTFALDPWVNEVVLALCGATPSPPLVTAPLPRIVVEDVVAEARLAAALAANQPDDTVILVSEATTASRVRDALARNGVACGWRDPAPLAAHTLAAIARRVAPWFSVDEPAIRLADLAWVLGHRLFDGLQRNGKQHLTRAIEDRCLTAPPEHLYRQAMPALFRATSLLDAPLSQWLVRLQSLADQEALRPAVRVAALGLFTRLRLLKACRDGQPFSIEFGQGERSFDGYDDRVAELLGEPPPSIYGGGAIPGGQSLGAVSRFLTSLRPGIQGDPGARAVLVQLHESRNTLTTSVSAVHALSVPLHDNRLRDGVDLLHVDHWDGRSCGQLIILDVHHQGITRRPTPDPLLSESQQAHLGACSGRARVAHRLNQVHRAAANAKNVVAIVAKRDAGGRDLVQPIQLRFCPHEHEAQPVGSYGFQLEGTAEVMRTHALTAQAGPPEPPSATVPSRLAHLAKQATVEWYRCGRGYQAAAPVVYKWESLPDRLEHLGELAPTWLLPWLGSADNESGRLDTDVAWSAGKLFVPMSECLYRAFATAVLNLEDPDVYSEDLDPRHIGEVVHQALEVAGAGLQMRVPEAQLAEARYAVVKALRHETDRRMTAISHSISALSSSRRAGVEGRTARWSAHWEDWAQSRVRKPKAPSDFDLKPFVQNHPLVRDVALAFLAALPEGHELRLDGVVRWLSEVSAAQFHNSDPLSWSDSRLCRERERWGPLPVRFALQAREILQSRASDLVNVWKSAVARGRGADASIIASAVELPFGPSGVPGQMATEDGLQSVHLGAVAVDFGPVRLWVRGVIDRIVFTRPRGALLLDVLDYKTGRTQPPKPFAAKKQIQRAEAPQLLLYALALQTLA